MKTITFTLIALFAPLLLSTTLFAGENNGHNPYRIRAYNLGAILDDQDNQPSSSAGFNALLITGNASDILLNEQNTTATWVETTEHTANSRGFALSAEFDASKNVSLFGAFGMTKNLWTPDAIDFENKSSWEANLGLIYRLVDHLSYELHFGYMDTGDLFYDRSTYSDVESIIMISNRLSLSF